MSLPENEESLELKESNTELDEIRGNQLKLIAEEDELKGALKRAEHAEDELKRAIERAELAENKLKGINGELKKKNDKEPFYLKKYL